jgi:hypothetical protein
LAGNWPEIAPNIPFPPNIPVRKSLKANDRPLCEQHGMEEVVGSIPTRSTISFSTVYPEFHSPTFRLRFKPRFHFQQLMSRASKSPHRGRSSCRAAFPAAGGVLTCIHD